MQPVPMRKPFNRQDLLTLRLHRRHQTTVHRLSTHNDRAGTAFAMTATFFGPREVQVFPDDLQKRSPGFHHDPNGLTIDHELDGFASHSEKVLCAFLKVLYNDPSLIRNVQCSTTNGQ